TDNAAVFLIHAWKKSRNIDKRNQRNIERIAEPHEARALIGGVDIERSGQHRRLVGNYAHGASADAPEAHHQVLGEIGLHLHEIAAIHHARDDLLYVVTALGIGGNDIVQIVVVARRAAGIQGGRLFPVVVWQKREQPLANLHGLHVVFGDEMDHAGLVHLGARPAQFIGRDDFAGHLLDD